MSQTIPTVETAAEFSSIQPPEVIPYFDVDNGTLLVGESAVQKHFEAGNTAIFTLGSLIAAKEFDTSAVKFGRFDTSDWTEQEALNYCIWALHVVQSQDPSLTLQQRHIRRLSVLGLGPNEKGLLEIAQTNSLTELRAKLGIEKEFRGYFDDWTEDDYYRHVRKVYAGKNRRLIGSDFDDYAKVTPGVYPTMKRMQPHVTIFQANEYLGHPNIDGWEPKDFVDWGVSFMRANDGLLPTVRMVNYLATQDRGPYESRIQTMFESYLDYKTQVIRRYHNEQLFKLAKIEAYRQQAKAGGLPVELQTATDAEVLKAGGLIRLAAIAVPQLDSRTNEELLLAPAEVAIDKLLSMKRGATQADMEKLALRLGVFSDIWPDARRGVAQYLHLADPKSFTGSKHPDYFDDDPRVLRATSGKLTTQSPELRGTERQRIILFGRIIRHKRLLAGRSCPQVATEVGIHPMYLYALETTKPTSVRPYAKPSKRTIHRLAAELDLDMAILNTLAGHAA